MRSSSRRASRPRCSSPARACRSGSAFAASCASPLLTTPVHLASRPGEHQVWKHLRLAAAAGAAIPAAPDVSWAVSAANRDAAPRASRRPAGGRRLRRRARRVFRARGQALGPRALCGGLRRDGRAARPSRRPPRERRGEGSQRAGCRSREEGRAVRPFRPDVAARSARSSRRGAVFLGNDSGLAHLASAAGTPAVVVFGSTDPDATRPWDGPRPDGKPVRLALVRRRTLCAPCRFDVCPIDHACMEGVTPEDVLAAADSVLA